MKQRMKQLLILCLAIAALSGCKIPPLESIRGLGLSATAPEPNALAGANGDLLIRNAILLSPERDEPLYNMDLLIQDGYIQKIAQQIEASADVTVVDANGRYLIPGLIDSHVHVYHAAGLKPRYTEDFDALYDAYVEQAPRGSLYFGFTSVIELNESPDANQLAKIFKAATLDNAKAFGLADQLGTIEVGKRADLLLLAENPLADVSAYDTIEVVIVGGNAIERQRLSASQAENKNP